jgi:hypothetical protein
MIYALLSTSTPVNLREDIARAILASQDVGPFVQQGHILHIMNAHRGVTYYCIYCQDIVRPTRRNRPRGRMPVNDWYFEHTTENRCLGTDFGLGNGLVNLRDQGCYIQMGHELDANGQPAVWHRTRCMTIQGASTYCHLAQQHGCI